MIEYIFYAIVGAYYVSFCVALAHAEYKDRRNEHNKRMREFQNLADQNTLQIEMFLERDTSNRRLEPIIEESEFSV